jgi:CRISPR-associated protein Cas8b1/Cst1 subtype I-B
VNQEDEVITVNNSENILTTNTTKNAVCHQIGSYKIPTIRNGIVKNSDIQKPFKTKSKPQRAKSDKSIKCDHKVHIIGDSHLKGSANNINQYLNTNFVVSSFIKPGANIK